MQLIIPEVLPRDVALDLGRDLGAAAWIDGNITSGTGAALAKRNRQLPEASAEAAQTRGIVQQALAASQMFLSAALPRAIYPPLFNCYGPGDTFAPHIDNAIRVDPQSGQQMRTDLSATLFLSEDYDGGELVIENQPGIRLKAGDMMLYPATSIHHVSEVTRGERIACFFWIESLVRDNSARETLFDLDQTVQALTLDCSASDEQILRLTKLYHNLVRRWAA